MSADMSQALRLFSQSLYCFGWKTELRKNLKILL